MPPDPLIAIPIADRARRAAQRLPLWGSFRVAASVPILADAIPNWGRRGKSLAMTSSRRRRHRGPCPSDEPTEPPASREALTVGELAWVLGIGMGKARQLISGENPAIFVVRFGRSVWMARSAVEAYLATGGDPRPVTS
jgi:hypothetical protein